MGAVVPSATGLRTSRRISHVFVMDVPTYARTLLVTDAAIKELGMRLPYSPPLIVPLSSGSSSGSNGSIDATSSGDADASITTSQGPTGSGDV